MKPKTKVIIIIAVIVALLVAALIIYWESTHGNRRLIDTKYRFDRAIIQLQMERSSTERSRRGWISTIRTRYRSPSTARPT